MKFIDIKSKKVYFDTGGVEYYITAEFWKALKAGKIRYKSGGTGGEDDSILYTEILTLNLDDDNFDRIFDDIALSDSGSAMMVGKLPVTDII